MWFLWLVVARRWNKEGLVFVPMRQQVGREGESLSQWKLVTRGRSLTGWCPLHLGNAPLCFSTGCVCEAGEHRYWWWVEISLMNRGRRRYRVIYGGDSHVRLVAAVASLAELFLLGNTDNWKAMGSRLHHLCQQIVEWALALYGWIHSAIVDVVKKVPHIFWHCPNSLWPPLFPVVYGH